MAGRASADAAADVARRNTPLHFAVVDGHANVMAALINAGASVNIQNSSGWAFCGGAACVLGRASVEVGAAVARRMTPLCHAAESGHAAATAALINAGASVNIQATHCRWAFCAVLPVRRGGPVPMPVPPLPAGTRRCTALPPMATPM